MGLFDRIANLFGLKKHEVKVLVVGLNNSGKSTVLNHLKSDDDKSTEVVPTVGFSVEKFKSKLFNQSQQTCLGLSSTRGMFCRKTSSSLCSPALNGSQKSRSEVISDFAENLDETLSNSGGLNNQTVFEPNYYFENGFRKVYPYKYIFTANTKLAWFNRSIKSVFEEYFGMNEKQTMAECEKGFIRINGRPVGADYTFKNGDILHHDVHFHESPVLNRPIKIIYQDDEKLVIDKPCSVPVHKVGHYLQNTVLEILRREHGISGVLNINRLDRVTSGVLVLATNSETAKKLTNLFVDDEMQKVYVARVCGKFPKGGTLITKRIKQISFSTGYSEVDDAGRDCVTKFRRLFYDEKTDSSVVLCTPLTGRTHQIRVHLTHMKHPIVNDILYNPQPSDFEQKVFIPPNRGIFWEIDENCLKCKSPPAEPNPKELELYLHALCYTGPDWKYETALPPWANPDWEGT